MEIWFLYEFWTLNIEHTNYRFKALRNYSHLWRAWILIMSPWSKKIGLYCNNNDIIVLPPISVLISDFYLFILKTPIHSPQKRPLTYIRCHTRGIFPSLWIPYDQHLREIFFLHFQAPKIYSSNSHIEIDDLDHFHRHTCTKRVKNYMNEYRRLTTPEKFSFELLRAKFDIWKMFAALSSRCWSCSRLLRIYNGTKCFGNMRLDQYLFLCFKRTTRKVFVSL